MSSDFEKRTSEYQKRMKAFDEYCEDYPGDIRCSPNVKKQIKKQERTRLLGIGDSRGNIVKLMTRVFVTRAFLITFVLGMLLTFLMGYVAYDYDWQLGLSFLIYSFLLIIVMFLHALPIPGWGFLLLAVPQIRVPIYEWSLELIGLQATTLSGFWYLLWMVMASGFGFLLGLGLFLFREKINGR